MTPKRSSPRSPRILLRLLAVLACVPLGGCLFLYHEATGRPTTIPGEPQRTILSEGPVIPTGRVALEWGIRREGLEVRATRQVVTDRAFEVRARATQAKKCRAGAAHAPRMFPTGPSPEGREVLPTILLSLDLMFLLPAFIDLLAFAATDHEFAGDCIVAGDETESAEIQVDQRTEWEPASGLAVRFRLGEREGKACTTDATGTAILPLTPADLPDSWEGEPLHVSAFVEGLEDPVSRRVSREELERLLRSWQ
jgi:hypothetical protein